MKNNYKKKYKRYKKMWKDLKVLLTYNKNVLTIYNRGMGKNTDFFKAFISRIMDNLEKKKGVIK